MRLAFRDNIVLLAREIGKVEMMKRLETYTEEEKLNIRTEKPAVLAFKRGKV